MCVGSPSHSAPGAHRAPQSTPAGPWEAERSEGTFDEVQLAPVGSRGTELRAQPDATCIKEERPFVLPPAPQHSETRQLPVMLPVAFDAPRVSTGAIT